MSENDDAAELLFFDTFSHEVDTDINLDLVQFPKPVYITQVRIIPLGARVQADFPGGVRLGATNPSKFNIEFFVNDLGMPGASTFENLGQLEYNQNDCIHLECTTEKIPTDGLVLRGWYSTITLAVYGILTNSMNEPIASPPPPPCEPAAPEEICNLSGDGRNSVMPDEEAKEEWKEPLPGEVVAVAHAHKTTTSDYEREDLDYNITREHYHHSGDERRTRKASHSSEHSVSSRNRTHSESNERDYIRSRSERDGKSSRDWSRSPDYTSRRPRRKRSELSRSDVEEPHKWPPRTPPVSIDSPARPRSPDITEFVDEDDDVRYKLKSRSYMRSSESLINVAQETHVIDDDETPGTPGEQFEPILSDDEIIGDDDSNAAAEQIAADEFEMEIIAAATAAKPAIAEFDAFKSPISKYENDLHSHYSKELENLKLLFKKFELQTKIDSLERFKEATTTVDERENFVYLSEQLINQLSYLTQQFKRRNFVLQQFFKSDARNLRQGFDILQIALDFEAACLQQQPAFKIRHIKVGARLAELFGASAEFFNYLQEQQFEPFTVLFSLYQQNYMALSIKLMLLKAVYALLDTKAGVRHFLGSKLNGYQLVLNTLQQTHLTRTKYALQAIIKKMNLNEALECIRENCTKVFIFSNYQESAYAESYLLIEQAIEQVLDALALNALSFQQPKRFLPVSKKFEIFADAVAQRSFANALQAYFTQHSLGESMLLMFANSAQLPMSLLLRCLDLLETMLKTHIGVDYFVDDCFETTQMLVATLLGIDDVPVEQHDDTTETSDEKTDEFEPKGEKGENETTIASKNAVKSETEENVVDENLLVNKAKCSSPSSIAVADVPGDAPPNKQVLHRMQNLGIELAYKSQTRYHLDAIVFTATSNDYDSIKLASHLHALYSQTCNSLGRLHTIEVIGFNNNLQVFMDLVKKEQRLQAQRQLSSPGAKYKSPVLSYAVDMIDCCVRYCEKLDYLMEHGANLLELAKNHETFEPSVSAVLQEMYVYLKPLETINIFAYDDITPLVEVITRSLEYITTFPGDLIMGLRILRHLAIGPACSSLKSGDTEELKHRFVSLQFYAADGVQTLVQILEKLCSYFEQPGLHSPALMTIQGLHCCQIMLPSLQVLREMLSFAIQSRDVQFKDLTAIDHLMKAYFLMHYFPAANQASKEIELAKNEIIQTLLAYTQPNEQDEESLNKSLWTQMIREILKNIDGPSTFIPGLQVLAELLPLPLPIPLANNTHLMEAQTQRLITERKLWSAHLHPQSLQIAKLIETIAPSSFPPLSDLMKRICVHLADLAPNMTLLISRTLSDSLCTEWSNNAYTPTLHLWRLLHFFSRLTSYATLKSSALSILSGKLWELFQAILTISEPTDIALKCQTSIHIIMKSFLNADISLISPQSACTHEVNLASALPPKELIPRIVDATLTNLVNDSVTPDVSQFAAKNLIMISEHDITCHHLILALKLKRTEIQQWLQKLTQSNEKATNHISIELFLTLLCSLMQIAGDKYDDNSSTPQRTLKLKVADLSLIIGYQKEPATQPHVLQRIRIAYEQDKKNINDALLIDINKLITQLESFEGTTAMELDEDTAVSPEPTLPQAEGIVTQFAARPIFTSFDGTMDADSLLSVRCWLPTLGSVDVPFKFDGKYERVACNLTELSNSCLPPETNLTSDCKRVLHLSASPQSNRERTPTAPCFRTRRVEVEPSTGRPEKKIYITPRGRGFPRAPPSRGDLFRSRPPNTSRPPSLHVDDFLALETCGAQPTGPTGYNKIPTIMRGSRVGRNRGSRISSSVVYRKTKILRTSSPSTWNDGASPHYRTATAEPHFGGGGGESHYSPAHFIGRPRGRARARGYLR